MSGLPTSLKKKIISAIKSDATSATGGLVEVKKGSAANSVVLTVKRAGGCKNIAGLLGENGQFYYPRARIIADEKAFGMLQASGDQFVREVCGIMTGERGKMYGLSSGDKLFLSAESYTNQAAMEMLLAAGAGRKALDPLRKVISLEILAAADFQIKREMTVTSPRSASPSRRGSPRPARTIEEVLKSVPDGKYINVASCKPSGSLGNQVSAGVNRPVQFVVNGNRVPQNSGAICFSASVGPPGTVLGAAKQGATNFLMRYSEENDLDFTRDQIDRAIDNLMEEQAHQGSPRKKADVTAADRGPKRGRGASRVSVKPQ